MGLEIINLEKQLANYSKIGPWLEEKNFIFGFEKTLYFYIYFTGSD